MSGDFILTLKFGILFGIISTCTVHSDSIPRIKAGVWTSIHKLQNTRMYAVTEQLGVTWTCGGVCVYPILASDCRVIHVQPCVERGFIDTTETKRRLNVNYSECVCLNIMKQWVVHMSHVIVRCVIWRFDRCNYNFMQNPMTSFGGD